MVLGAVLSAQGSVRVQVRVSGRDQLKFKQSVVPFPSSSVLGDALELRKSVVSLQKHSQGCVCPVQIHAVLTTMQH